MRCFILCAMVVGMLGCGSVTAAKDPDGGAGAGGTAGAGLDGAAGETDGGGLPGDAGGTGGIGGIAGSMGAAGSPIQLGPNLVSNGDFSNGQTGWTVVQPAAGTATTTVIGGQLCVMMTKTESAATMPASIGFVLPPGETFELSYQINATQQTELITLAGPTTNPYGGIEFTTPEWVYPASPLSLTYTFTTTAGYSSAEVAIVLNAVAVDQTATPTTTACISSVSLRQVLDGTDASSS